MVRTLAQNRHNKEICIQGQVGGYSVLHDYGDTGWKKLPRETGVGEEQLGRNLSGKQKGRLCSKNIRFRRVDKLNLRGVEFSVFSALAENVLNIFSFSKVMLASPSAARWQWELWPLGSDSQEQCSHKQSGAFIKETKRLPQPQLGEDTA